jgi:hypothetical protein
MAFAGNRIRFGAAERLQRLFLAPLPIYKIRGHHPEYEYGPLRTISISL